MIAFLHGKIVSVSPVGKRDNNFVINVNGVGYLVQTTGKILGGLKLEDEVTIHTHLAVREDAQDLYGFDSPEAVTFFKMLIGVPGIGPKSALTVLEAADLEDIRHSVAADNPETLVKVSGMSKRMAEKVVVGLQSKIKDFTVKNVSGATPAASADTEVIEALEALGFKPADIRDSLKNIDSEGKESGEIVKEVLRGMGNS
ncbi:Holliday junction branch migration protein RuvA [Candidatus Woesebacteria bacterium]|nr:Holliday junction branch migration protein RuvA [Candidatus Woesebacteria bacterium]|tara:strand:+ start:290 stop:889 length:600 start_codon:yes stop_codon:yes gene_type:complete